MTPYQYHIMLALDSNTIFFLILVNSLTLSKGLTHYGVVEDLNMLNLSLCSTEETFLRNPEPNPSELLENFEEMYVTGKG